MNSEIRYLAQQLLHAGLGPLCERDRRVIARVARRVHTARDVNQVFEQNLSFGDRLADKVAVVAGSWTFIVGLLRVPRGLGAAQRRRPGAVGVRPLSLHLPQPAAVDAGGAAGAHHHDEPEPAGGEGPPRGLRSTTRSTSRPSPPSPSCTTRSTAWRSWSRASRTRRRAFGSPRVSGMRRMQRACRRFGATCNPASMQLQVTHRGSSLP